MVVGSLHHGTGVSGDTPHDYEARIIALNPQLKLRNVTESESSHEFRA
jgi:hypothetical protein